MFLITGKTSGWEPQLSHSSPKAGVTKEEGAIILYLSFSRHLYFPFDTEEDNLASIRFPNEYSHFQVTCPECGKELPPNTLKRHIAKHKKTKEQTKAPGTPNDQVVLYILVHFCTLMYIFRDLLMRGFLVLSVEKCFQRMQWSDI